MNRNFSYRFGYRYEPDYILASRENAERMKRDPVIMLVFRLQRAQRYWRLYA